MSNPSRKRSLSIIAAMALASVALAADNPILERQEVMKSVREAAKPVGNMLRGDIPFDAGVVRASLQTFHEKSMVYGDLFPAGSESGNETEAAPTIWEDRAGFEAALGKWREATQSALEANPQTLAEAKPVLGPVFSSCKGCHDDYRIDKD